jgi:hypothetical protein
VVAWRAGVRLGPSEFSFWGLLLVLGFVAAIGAVLSWFWATGSRPERSETAPRSKVAESAPERDAHLGRPAPEVRAPPPPVVVSSPSPPPWDEGPIVASRLESRTLAAPRPWTDADAEVALMELEGIQREIVPRRKSPVRRS